LFNLQIIRERVNPNESQEGVVWNSLPGALWTRRTFSDATEDYPFSWAKSTLSNKNSGCEIDKYFLCKQKSFKLKKKS